VLSSFNFKNAVAFLTELVLYAVKFFTFRETFLSHPLLYFISYRKFIMIEIMYYVYLMSNKSVSEEGITAIFSRLFMYIYFMKPGT